MSSSPAAVPATSSGKVEDWLAWGVAQRPCKKNEDRYVATCSSTAPWADFVTAVLDGHNGRRAAETCAMRLVPLVNEELARLEKSVGAPPRDDGRDDSASPNWHPQVRGWPASCDLARPQSESPGCHTQRTPVARRALPGALLVELFSAREQLNCAGWGTRPAQVHPVPFKQSPLTTRGRLGCAPLQWPAAHGQHTAAHSVSHCTFQRALTPPGVPCTLCSSRLPSAPPSSAWTGRLGPLCLTAPLPAWCCSSALRTVRAQRLVLVGVPTCGPNCGPSLARPAGC